jgi:hypothetical protein
VVPTGFKLGEAYVRRTHRIDPISATDQDCGGLVRGLPIQGSIRWRHGPVDAPSDPAMNTGFPATAAPTAAPPTAICRPLASVERFRALAPSDPPTSTGFPVTAVPAAP